MSGPRWLLIASLLLALLGGAGADQAFAQPQPQRQPPQPGAGPARRVERGPRPVAQPQQDEEEEEVDEAEQARLAAEAARARVKGQVQQVLARATQGKDATLTAEDLPQLDITVELNDDDKPSRVVLGGLVATREGRETAERVVGALPGVTRVDNQLRVMDPEQQKQTFRSSKWVALVFWGFAFMIIGGALFVVTRRNLIAAVMGMVATFFAIAVVYAMLFAHFMAVIQVLVYAGAIMVLFVFVIMILNKPEDQPWSRQAWPGKLLAIAAAGYLLFRMGTVLWDAKAATPEHNKPPGELIVRQTAIDETPQTAPFGSTRAVGKTLFQDYLFPFEAISLVLLVAVVGALAVARPHHEKHEGGAAESPE